MGIFSKFFNKKKSPPLALECDKPEPELEPDVQCSLRFILSYDEDVGIECEWDEESLLNFAQLIYVVNSGQMTEGLLKIIKDSCTENGKEKDYVRLLGFLQTLTSGQGLEQQDGEIPLVKPTQVMGTSLDDNNIPI